MLVRSWICDVSCVYCLHKPAQQLSKKYSTEKTFICRSSSGCFFCECQVTSIKCIRIWSRQLGLEKCEDKRYGKTADGVGISRLEKKRDKKRHKLWMASQKVVVKRWPFFVKTKFFTFAYKKRTVPATTNWNESVFCTQF